MKFETLSLLKQANLIIDLAQLHLHMSEFDAKKPASCVLKGTGLSLPIDYVRLSNKAYFTPYPKEHFDDEPRMTLVFEYKGNDRSQICFEPMILAGENKDENFDRFGLYSNMCFSPPFDKSFLKGAKYIRSIETVNGSDHVISDTLKKLAKTATKVSDIPENLLDLYFVNHSVVNKLQAMARAINMSDMDGELSENKTDPYDITVLYNNRTITSYLPNTDNKDRYDLIIDLGYGGDDKVEIRYYIGNAIVKNIATVVPVNHPEPDKFVKDLLVQIAEAVRSSDVHAELENKLLYFLDTCNGVMSVITDSLSCVSGKET